MGDDFIHNEAEELKKTLNTYTKYADQAIAEVEALIHERNALRGKYEAQCSELAFSRALIVEQNAIIEDHRKKYIAAVEELNSLRGSLSSQIKESNGNCIGHDELKAKLTQVVKLNDQKFVKIIQLRNKVNELNEVCAAHMLKDNEHTKTLSIANTQVVSLSEMVNDLKIKNNKLKSLVQQLVNKSKESSHDAKCAKLMKISACELENSRAKQLRQTDVVKDMLTTFSQLNMNINNIMAEFGLN